MSEKRSFHSWAENLLAVPDHEEDISEISEPIELEPVFVEPVVVEPSPSEPQPAKPEPQPAKHSRRPEPVPEAVWEPVAEPEPRRAHNGDLLSLIRDPESLSVFGGKLFRYDMDTTSCLGFAVLGQNAADVDRCDSYYRRMGDPYKSYITYIGTATAADYTVYRFRLPVNAYSLMEGIRYETQKETMDCQNLTKQLLMLLHEHYAEDASVKPLMCISPCTVFIHPEGAGFKVRLLPLLAHNNAYPVSIPRDPVPDATTDAYAALHTVLQYQCGALADNGQPITIPNDPLIMSALLPASTNRPRLERLIREAVPEFHPVPHRTGLTKGRNPRDDADAPSFVQFFQDLWDRFRNSEVVSELAPNRTPTVRQVDTPGADYDDEEN